jgi:hypothetical protein
VSLAAEPRNGQFVTWRELSLKVDPLAEDVKNINVKLDAVLIGLARSDGERSARSSLFDHARFWMGLAVTFCAGTISAVVTIVILKP